MAAKMVRILAVMMLVASTVIFMTVAVIMAGEMILIWVVVLKITSTMLIIQYTQ